LLHGPGRVKAVSALPKDNIYTLKLSEKEILAESCDTIHQGGMHLGGPHPGRAIPNVQEDKFITAIANLEPGRPGLAPGLTSA
jgi:hypothetical protein